MIQPECFDGIPVLEPEAPPSPGVPAFWFLVGLVVALAIFELWALHTGHNTVSHMLQRALKAHVWLRWVAALGWAVIGWHLFWGFPW